jgi:hypothetical protein
VCGEHSEDEKYSVSDRQGRQSCDGHGLTAAPQSHPNCTKVLRGSLMTLPCLHKKEPSIHEGVAENASLWHKQVLHFSRCTGRSPNGGPTIRLPPKRTLSRTQERGNLVRWCPQVNMRG